MSASTDFGNALAHGAVLLWYEIERVLGQGAFGITYLAQDTNLKRPVAIKEYLPAQFARREGDGTVQPLGQNLAEEFAAGRQRFIAEARTLARFEHPNIVRVHNVFEAHGTAYLVMQYEDGEGFDRLLKRRGTLGEDELLRILHPLLDGLEAIHAQAFVHRDIKPANIFIRSDGAPVLLDFGSARQAMLGEARTLTNFVSPGYAPIEQYAGKSDSQGPWSDIYGLGATLYRAMAGRAPTDAVERSHALAQETADSYQTGVIAAGQRYSTALLEAVDVALSFRAQDRPQTVAAWRQRLPPPTAREDGAASPATDTTTARVNVGAPTLMVTLVTSQAHSPAAGLAAAPAEAAPLATATRSAAREGSAERPARTRFGWRHYLALSACVLLAAIATGAWLGRQLGELSTPVVLGRPASDAAVARATPSVVVPTPAVAPAAPTTPDRIAELTALANLDLQALRLMSPPAQNAYEKYREILALDPGNLAAQRGIEAISDRYLGLVYRDLEAGRLARAERYLGKAEIVSPQRASVLEARRALARARTVAATAPVATPAATAPAPADPPTSRMQEFRQRFDSFVREQKRAQPPRSQTRADDLIDRLGGGN